MNCEEARQAWHSEFEDGRANSALGQHLNRCAACASYAADMRRIVGALADLRSDTESTASLRRPDRVARTLWSMGFFRVAAAIVLAAGLFAAYWAFSPRRAIENGKDRIAADGSTQPHDATPWRAEPTLGITLQGASARKLLAVAAPSANPDVQLYWLYPRLDDVVATSP